MDQPAAIPPGFSPPDWDAPVDIEAQLRLLPAGKAAKGFVLAGLAKRLKERGHQLSKLDKVVGFKDYSYADQMHAFLEGGLLLNPKAPRRGLREAGRMAFPAALETLAGRVVFGVLGKDPSAVFRVSAKAYEMVGTGMARAVDVGKRHAHVELKELYLFPESYHVGVCEGVVLECGHEPDVYVKQHHPAHVEVFIRW